MDGAWALAIITAVGLVAGAVIAVYKIVRDGQMARAFAKDIAINHLPHLYHTVSLIAKKLEIEVDDPPPIRYLPFDKN